MGTVKGVAFILTRSNKNNPNFDSKNSNSFDIHSQNDSCCCTAFTPSSVPPPSLSLLIPMADNRRLPDWALSKRSRNHSSSDDSSSLTRAALVAGSALVAYAGYELNRSVRRHGWEGTLRLIWEGDVYDSELRDAVDKLEEAEFDLLATYRIDDRLKGLETTLDACTSSSQDTLGLDKLWNQIWMEHSDNCTSNNDRPLTIERTLGDMSDRLDKIAAKIDGVILSSHQSNNFLAQKVKDRKKFLSKTIVSEMERCDALMASYQVLKERANE